MPKDPAANPAHIATSNPDAPARELDPNRLEKKLDAVLHEVDELLEEDKHGDEHYPGDALRERINLKMNLPRRT